MKTENMNKTVLHSILERASERHGKRIAVWESERQISYAALNRRANQMARSLARGFAGIFDRCCPGPGRNAQANRRAFIGVCARAGSRRGADRWMLRTVHRRRFRFCE